MMSESKIIFKKGLNPAEGRAYRKRYSPLLFTRVARRGRASPSRTASRSRSARPLMIDKGGKGAPPRPRSRQVHARLWGEGVGRGLCAEDDGAEAGLSRFPSCSIGESDESSESFIHGVRVRKPLGDIRREHDHIASGCIAFGVLSPYSLAEIIFRQHVHAPLTLGVLHSCSFPIAWPSGR